MFQVQKSVASNEQIQNLFFSHPVKLIASKCGGAATSNTSQIVLQLNGTDISKKKWARPHYTTVTSYYNAPYSTGNAKTFFLYPFCLDTSSSQPCGSVNFSRLDSARFISDNETFTQDFYSINYNVLRIKNGMGGLLYSD